MRLRPNLPSPSMAVAITALFVALGGTGYAASQLPGGHANAGVAKKKKPTACLAAAQSLCSSLKAAVDREIARADDSPKDLAGLNAFLAVTPVPNAKHASSADTATHATSADTAGAASPTGSAGGALTGSYPNPGLAGPEPVHRVGAAGQPAFQGTFANVGGGFETAGFYKDPLGIVHLVGDVSGTGTTIFTLPSGYRPRSSERFLVPAATDTTSARLKIDPDGTVNIFPASTPTAFNGISFRTDQ